ncbi:hypothetical protein BHE90_010106 [Fusarium euwallaceae]|uniref:Uncharacterized protein n=1 Tax=Fusarium euwallaceae TaxID=1147111 RepID=A0A430LI59_9HYPO|nr:hypothetical protein BHE90_010106 [Fusarium euwallaceae]
MAQLEMDIPMIHIIRGQINQSADSLYQQISQLEHILLQKDPDEAGDDNKYREYIDGLLKHLQRLQGDGIILCDSFAKHLKKVTDSPSSTPNNADAATNGRREQPEEKESGEEESDEGLYTEQTTCTPRKTANEAAARCLRSLNYKDPTGSPSSINSTTEHPTAIRATPQPELRSSDDEDATSPPSGNESGEDPTTSPSTSAVGSECDDTVPPITRTGLKRKNRDTMDEGRKRTRTEGRQRSPSDLEAHGTRPSGRDLDEQGQGDIIGGSDGERLLVQPEGADLNSKGGRLAGAVLSVFAVRQFIDDVKSHNATIRMDEDETTAYDGDEGRVLFEYRRLVNAKGSKVQTRYRQLRFNKAYNDLRRGSRRMPSDIRKRIAQSFGISSFKVDNDRKAGRAWEKLCGRYGPGLLPFIPTCRPGRAPFHVGANEYTKLAEKAEEAENLCELHDFLDSSYVREICAAGLAFLQATDEGKVANFAFLGKEEDLDWDLMGEEEVMALMAVVRHDD